MKKRLFVLILFTLTLLSLSACGETTSNEINTNEGEQKSYSFKIAHETPETHIKHLVAEKFKEELESKTEERMTVDIFPAKQLGGDKELVQQIETGTLDFAMINNGTLSSMSESMNAWFMPFLFNNLEDAAEARKSDAAKEMLKELEVQGIIGFDVFFAGNRHILMKSDEVNSVGDLKGKKIRIPGSPVFEEFYKKIGSGPTPMPLGEVYTSLQTGVIDGVDTDLDAPLSQNFYETGKNLILTNHMAFPEVAIASKTVFDKVSSEDQQIIKKAMESAVEWGVQKAIELENARIQEIKSKGVNVTKISGVDQLQPINTEMYEKYSEKNSIIKSFIEQNK